MARTVVKTIWNADRDQRVDIFQRDDETFGFQELHYALDEQAWLQFGRYSESYTESQEAAVFEASSRVRWVASLLETSQ